MNDSSNFVDYYSLLGVGVSASAEEIKSAYRRLIRQHHPDVNPDPSALEFTKTINTAYEILTNSAARHAFDVQRDRYYKEHTTNKKQHPSEHEFTVTISLLDAFYGTEVTLKNDTVNLKVRIPAGVDSGERLQVQIIQEMIYVIVLVKRDENIRREGKDLYLDYPVTFVTAVMGGEILVRFFNEETIVRVPPGTSSDNLLRIREKGMPKVAGEGARGDLFLRLLIRVPEKLSGQAELLFKQFAEALKNM